MANANTPFGLKPVKDAGSGYETGGLSMYYVPATDGTALYIGDPVVKAGSSDGAGNPSVTIAAAGGPITGVVMGFVPDGTTDQAGYRAASTAAYVLVCDNPDEAFIIQEDGVGGQLAAADVGLNASIIVAAGNAYSKRSGVMLDSSTKATTAGLELKILGLAPIPGNDFGAYAKFLVKINNHTEATASAGV
jgi:hypothetical protein